VDESRDGGDGRTAMSFGHDGGVASDSGGNAVGTGRGEAVRTAAAARLERGRSERHYAVGTLARGPDSAFNARARRGQRRLTGGTHSSAFFELKLPRTKITQNK
jgi:hypothetical protein